jgi:uncharacterized protein DUF4382
MGLTAARKIRTICRNCWKLRFCVALLSVVTLAGCNTCVTFTSNPPTGTLGIVASDPRPACTLPKMNAAVRPQLAAEPVCSSCAESSQVKHIFLGIRGVELNSNATAQDDAPDWQELLLPELEQKPLQIDLLESNVAQGVQAPFERAAHIPAGMYHQLRLRLVPNQLATEDRLPAKNLCGSGTFNCVVMANGSIQPLQIDDASSALRITSDKMEGASLSFLPDTATDLVLEWKLVWKWTSSADKGVRLAPALTGSAKVRHIKSDEMGAPEDEIANDSRSR